MKDFFAIQTHASTLVWQQHYQGEEQEKAQQGLRFNFPSQSLNLESSLASLAVQLSDLGESWIRPLREPSGDWEIDLAQLGKRFPGLNDQLWLSGTRVVRPHLDEIEGNKRREGVMRFVVPVKANPRTDTADIADFDPMLGLFRKEAFVRDIDGVVSNALNSGDPAALVMLDIDKFKSINDSYGHLVGDEVLVAIAAQVRRVVGVKGRCYRFGGEEFCMLLAGFSAEEAAALAERIRSEIERGPVTSRQISVTASLGIAVVPGHASGAKELVEKSDQAMYEAKRLGRNLVRISGETLPIFKPGVAMRRQPDPMGLSDDELESIRRDHFLANQSRCPRDGAALEVHVSHTHNRATPDLLVACPLCGLRATIHGPS